MKMFIVMPRDGETVYSIAARFHVLAGHPTDADTSKLLFGYQTAHRNWGCPVGLDQLQSASGGAIQASEATLRHRSQVGAFWTLIPAKRRCELLTICKGPNTVIKAQAKAGLARYNDGSKLLKFCTLCLDQQIAELGFSFWESQLQWPGVWICSRHRTVLWYYNVSTRKYMHWRLPHQVKDDAVRPPVSVSNALTLMRVQSTVEWLADRESINTKVLQTILRLRLRAAGYLRSELKILEQELTHIDAHSRQYYATITAPDIEKLNASSWLSKLITEQRHYNPLSWAAALALHGRCSEIDFDKEYRESLNRIPQRKIVGNHREGPRRSIAPHALYSAFSSTTKKSEAVEQSGFTAAEVNSWLRRDSSLKAHWRLAVTARRHNKSVSEIREFVQKHPTCKRVDVLRNCRLAYRWLKLNDAHTLASLLPQVLSKYSRQLVLGIE